MTAQCFLWRVRLQCGWMLVFRVSHMSGVARVRVCGSASNVHASGSNVLPGKAVCGLPQWQAWRQADNAARTILA